MTTLQIECTDKTANSDTMKMFQLKEGKININQNKNREARENRGKILPYEKSLQSILYSYNRPLSFVS